MLQKICLFSAESGRVHILIQVNSFNIECTLISKVMAAR